MYTQHNSFKNDFKFNFTTESFKFDSAECKALIADAIKIYDKDALNYKKVFVSAPSLTMFAAAAAELSRQGYTVLESERAHSASLGNFAIRFVKPHSLQSEDKKWIEEIVQEQYITKTEANAAAYKAKLKADLLADEKAKEAAKQAKAAADKDAKIQAEADKKFESLLQQQGIA